MKKNIIFTSLLLLLFRLGFAQAPNWAIENPGEYNNSMTITVVLNIASVESRNVNDKVAAFINGSLSGVVSPDNYILAKDRFFGSLNIYNNNTSGKITFKLYSATTGKITDAVNIPIDFVPDDNLGEYNNPVIIKDNNVPTQIKLSGTSVFEDRPLNTLIGNLSVVDEDVNDVFTFSFDDGQGYEDNASFVINDGKLYSNKIFNFPAKSSYTIRLKVTDALMGTKSQVFVIQILEKLIGDALVYNNIITPNNDGFNDYLKISNVHLYKDYNLSIYNSRGQLVYSAFNYSNNWSGAEQPSGIYFLMFSGKDDSGKEYLYKEQLQIINNQ